MLLPFLPFPDPVIVRMLFYMRQCLRYLGTHSLSISNEVLLCSSVYTPQ
jgi:hypothetical protein